MSILQSAPPEAWFVFFGALVGGLSAVFGAWITSRGSARQLGMQLEHQREEGVNERKRQRHEQLYVDCRKYFNGLACYYLPYESVMRGKLSYNQALDITDRSIAETNYDHNHVFMLLDYYFPELKEEYDAIMKCRERMNTIMRGFKEQYRNGNSDGSRWLRMFEPEYTTLVQRMEAFEERVANHRPPA